MLPRPGSLVLIAEDSLVNQVVAVRALERCGVRTDVVSDGLLALEALEAHHYDAVLMDCQMPNLDGYQATMELRRREQDGRRHTPVIAMTAHAMMGDREKCLEAGMDDYIAKPMRAAGLAEVLQRWIPGFADGGAAPAIAKTAAEPPACDPERVTVAGSLVDSLRF